MKDLIQKLISIKEKLMATLSLEEVYKEVVEESVVFVDAIYASLTLYQNKSFRRVYSTVPFAFMTKNRKKGNVYKAFTEKRLQVSTIAEMEKSHPELHNMGVVMSAFVPIIDNGAVLGVLTLNFPRKITEEDLQHLQLYASVAASAIRRVQYYEETREALMIRDNFLSIISHEVRTPLTVINGYLHLMKKKTEQGEPVQLNWIDLGLEEIEKVVKKVKELIDANDIQSGNTLPFLFEEINLRVILDNSFKYLKNRYPQRKIISQGHIPSEMRVVGDMIKLEYVFHNILENSIKFSPPETTTVIRVDVKKDNYLITVIDEGHGMTRSEMKKIFQGFYKAMKDAKTGMGIGLYLSQHILREHHGGLKILSKLETGTHVTIRLPVSNI